MTQGGWAVKASAARQPLVMLVPLVALGCGSSSSGDGANGNASGGRAGSSVGGSSGAGGVLGGAGAGGTSGASGTSGTTSGGSGGAPDACFDATTNHRPGSRLRSRTVVSSEGDRSWQGFQDSERDEGCYFTTATDGTLRCLPESALGQSTYFANAACTEPLFAFTTGCDTAARYVRQAATSGCGPVGIFERGAAYTESMAYQQLGTTCTNVPVPTAQTLVRRGAEASPSSFVSATAGEWPTPSGRVRSFGYTATDGTLQLRRWLDKQLDIECFPEETPDDALRCFDANRLEGPYYSDQACSTRILGRYQRCPNDPIGRYATVPGADACDVTLLERAAAHSGATYDALGSGCTERTSTAYTYFQVGAEVPWATFAELTEIVVMDDPGRVKPRFITTPEGGCWFDGWHDSELGVTCEFMLMPDGRYGCVPELYIVHDVAFSDSSCTAEFPLITITSCFAERVQPRYLSTPSYRDCGDPAREVRAVLEALEGSALPPLWTLSGDTCYPYPAIAEGTYLHLGPALDPSTLVGGSMSVE